MLVIIPNWHICYLSSIHLLFVIDGAVSNGEPWRCRLNGLRGFSPNNHFFLFACPCSFPSNSESLAVENCIKQMKRTGHETWVGNDRESETSHEFGLVASTRGPLVLVRHTKSGFDDDNNINAYFFFFLRLNCRSIAMFCSHRDTHRPVRNVRSLEVKRKGSFIPQQKVFQSPHNYFKELDLHLIADFFFLSSCEKKKRLLSFLPFAAQVSQRNCS